MDDNCPFVNCPLEVAIYRIIPCIYVVLINNVYSMYLLNLIAQQSAGQLVEARKLLESAQSLERNKQQLQFQHQQLLLKLQQAKEAQAMEQEFQKTMKLQVTEQAPNRSSAPNTSSTIKMVLRKRYF